MNLLLAIPLPLRLAAVFVAGAVVASFLNLAIYRWAFAKRPISPWSPPPQGASPRRWLDRVPILGWFALRRDSNTFGAGFWVRPLLVELATGAGLAWLYYWLVVERAAYRQFPFVAGLSPNVMVPDWVLHAQFLSAAVLIALMTIATFIDIDEKIIPDQVTAPGTILGLLLAVICPFSLLPILTIAAAAPPFNLPLLFPNGAPVKLPDAGGVFQPVFAGFLNITSPRPWPDSFGGAPHVAPLAAALLCYWFWLFALIERPWFARHGARRALAVCVAHMIRQLRRAWIAWAMTLLVGSAAIFGVWRLGGMHWAGLLTALVGMVAGGGIIWAVRIIGRVTLKKEAMGFGDVTLMMMIGSFVGWQTCLLIFFLAPFAGLVIGVAQFLLRRDDVIPYGPFLCLATVAAIVCWGPFWNWARWLFKEGLLVPNMMAVCFVLMFVLLGLWRIIKESILGSRAA